MTPITASTAELQAAKVAQDMQSRQVQKAGELIAQSCHKDRFILIGCLIGGMLKGGMNAADIFSLFDCASDFGDGHQRQ